MKGLVPHELREQGSRPPLKQHPTRHYVHNLLHETNYGVEAEQNQNTKDQAGGCLKSWKEHDWPEPDQGSQVEQQW
jgi:hypothetical protein